MAHHGSRCHCITPKPFVKSTSAQRDDSCELPKATARLGFIVWIGRPYKCFLSWSETSVADLSPFLADAWSYPSAKAANSAISRALGPAVEDISFAIFPRMA
jgi:hypothetical protein